MNNMASEYINQKMLAQKREIDKSTIVVEDFNTLLTNLKNKQAKSQDAYRIPQKHQ